jgi:hypothetical protein
MPHGGRRPGAGAPKGNFNAAKGGAYSPRMRLALAALLSMPEYRAVIRALLSAGDEARHEFAELLVTSTRLLYERPLNDELRAAAARAGDKFVARVGPTAARKALRRKQHNLGVDAILPRAKRRRRTAKNNPVFREFADDVAGSLSARSARLREQRGPGSAASPRPLQPTTHSLQPPSVQLPTSIKSSAPKPRAARRARIRNPQIGQAKIDPQSNDQDAATRYPVHHHQRRGGEGTTPCTASQ